MTMVFTTSNCDFLCFFGALQSWQFWVEAAGAEESVKARLGFPPWVLEVVYQKYLNGRGYERLDLWYAAAWVKQYPLTRNLECLRPRVHVGYQSAS